MVSCRGGQRTLVGESARTAQHCWAVPKKERKGKMVMKTSFLKKHAVIQRLIIGHQVRWDLKNAISCGHDELRLVFLFVKNTEITLFLTNVDSYTMFESESIGVYLLLTRVEKK